jgi:peroxiredoxin Q/BCP
MRAAAPRALLVRAFRVALAIALTVSAGACAQPRRPDGGVGLLQPAALAPDFVAPDQDAHPRALAEFRGRPVVLYFYPKDGTPGCTKEACAFRDAWKRYEAASAVVLGVSRDSVEKHRAFATEHALPFPLLADESGAICEKYGVRSTLGYASRVTFLIDRDGRVARVFPDVDPGVHAEELLAAIAALPGAK